MSDLESVIAEMKNHPNFDVIVSTMKNLLQLGTRIDTLHLIAIFENGTSGGCSVYRGNSPRSLTVEQVENAISELRRMI